MLRHPKIVLSQLFHLGSREFFELNALVNKIVKRVKLIGKSQIDIILHQYI